MTASASIAFFAMDDDNHFQRLLPLISRVAARGLRTIVWSDRKFASRVSAAGATFRDLFAGRALHEVDRQSRPLPCRFVTFAGVHGKEIAGEVAATAPDLVVHSAFAVIGRVVAAALDIPRVQVCSGHNVQHARFVADLAKDPRVAVTPECRRAAAILREDFGLAEASVFAYVGPPSSDLNVYGEPPEFLTALERRGFEPVAFFGSLHDEVDFEPSARHAGAQRIYVSFGTIVWRYYAREALAALTAIAEAVASRSDARALVTLGGAEVDATAVARIEQPNVRVERWVDQRAALAEADVFVTHHGLNSTHEAVAAGVPMIGYPFFWDQPALAARCAELKLAIPLGRHPRATLSAANVGAAFDALEQRRSELAGGLAAARAWELATIANRDAVVERIVELAGR